MFEETYLLFSRHKWYLNSVKNRLMVVLLV